MLYAFDLDGTLFNTKALVKRCYEEFGIEMPADAFGKTWREWLIPLCGGDELKAQWVHDEKNTLYAKLAAIGVAKPLPLFYLYVTIADWSVILTGASQVAALALLNRFPEVNCRVQMNCEMTRVQKINWMNQRINGIMFEDDILAAEQMRKETQWTILHSPQ